MGMKVSLSMGVSNAEDDQMEAHMVSAGGRSERHETVALQSVSGSARRLGRALLKRFRGPIRVGENGLDEEDWRRLLVFVHIPKAAGTSFNDVLRRVYGRTFLQFHPRLHNFDMSSVTAEQARNVLALSAHLPYGFHRRLGPQIAKAGDDGLFQGRTIHYISVVRDPVDRLYSLYRYVSVTPPHILHVTTKGMDCRTFFDYLAQSGHGALSNQQCALINGRRGDAASAIRKVEENYLAVVTLDNISGLVSYLDRTLKWPAGNAQIGVHNRTTNRNDPAELHIVKQFAEQHCAEDIALFNHVRATVSPRFC